MLGLAVLADHRPVLSLGWLLKSGYCWHFNAALLAGFRLGVLCCVLHSRSLGFALGGWECMNER